MKGFVSLAAATLMQGALAMPIDGSVARSMPQFALLMILAVVLLNLLSGGNLPTESMPPAEQTVTLAAPTTHFVGLSQAILCRRAGMAVVWPQLVAIAAIGTEFFAVALARFRHSIALS